MDTPLAIKIESQPLVGECAFFDGSFYLGFWREPVFRGPEDVNPHNAQCPPGQTMAAMQAAKAQAATLARFKTPEACRYGDRCRHKLSCSRHHGPDPATHAVNCACEEERCPLGHPLRAGRERGTAGAAASGAGGGAAAGGGPRPPGGGAGGPMPTGRRPPPSYVCAKCKVPADHYLNECPQNTCYRCGGKGHIATHCTQARQSDDQRKRGPPGELEEGPEAQMRRMSAEAAARGPSSGMGGMGGGGGLRME